MKALKTDGRRKVGCKSREIKQDKRLPSEKKAGGRR